MDQNPPKPQKQLKVLIADDSSIVRKVIEQTAASMAIPMHIDTADNGEDCLHALTKGKFDIAFVDVYMPKLNGLEALAMTRHYGNDTFVVVMSSKADEERLKVARALKAYDYLAKPFRADDITRVINNYRRFIEQSSVLIVDDSSTVRKILSNVMDESLFNIEVDEAGDGADALAQYKKKTHDIVFLDINMPGISGLDVYHLLNKANPDIHAVLMTADRSEALAKQISAVGAPHFLYKPFYSQDVDRILHELFDLIPPELAVTAAE